MLLGTLGASSKGNLSGKEIVRAGYGIKQREYIVRAGYGSSVKKEDLIPPHRLTNFEIQKYYENEPRFNGVYSRDNLPKKIKNGAYVINWRITKPPTTERPPTTDERPPTHQQLTTGPPKSVPPTHRQPTLRQVLHPPNDH